MAVEYKRYLASREWALRREAVKRRADGTCERCHTLPLRDVHHLSYANVGNEPLTDLQGICGPCHDYESGKADMDPNDVIEWIWASCFAKDDNHWGECWKQDQEASWSLKYGSDWEAWFISFTVRNHAGLAGCFISTVDSAVLRAENETDLKAERP